MRKILLAMLVVCLICCLVACGEIDDLINNPNQSSDECPYCGDLAGGNRWFIAKVTDQGMLMPLGTDCFEAKAAGEAGISINATSGTLEEGGFAVGDVIRVTYGGEVMESYPVQIAPISIERADIDQ